MKQTLARIVIFLDDDGFNVLMGFIVFVIGSLVVAFIVDSARFGQQHVISGWGQFWSDLIRAWGWMLMAAVVVYAIVLLIAGWRKLVRWARAPERVVKALRKQ